MAGTRELFQKNMTAERRKMCFVVDKLIPMERLKRAIGERRRSLSASRVESFFLIARWMPGAGLRRWAWVLVGGASM
jgi:hypothetical protein